MTTNMNQSKQHSVIINPLDSTIRGTRRTPRFPTLPQGIYPAWIIRHSGRLPQGIYRYKALARKLPVLSCLPIAHRPSGARASPRQTKGRAQASSTRAKQRGPHPVTAPNPEAQPHLPPQARPTYTIQSTPDKHFPNQHPQAIPPAQKQQNIPAKPPPQQE
jgi:hypothetical protein